MLKCLAHLVQCPLEMGDERCKASGFKVFIQFHEDVLHFGKKCHDDLIFHDGSGRWWVLRVGNLLGSCLGKLH